MLSLYGPLFRHYAILADVRLKWLERDSVDAQGIQLCARVKVREPLASIIQ